MSEANPILESPAAETPLIEVRNLRKVYQVPGGEVVALAGAIQEDIKKRFGIALEPEAIII